MTDKARLEFSFDFQPTGKPRQPDQPFRLLIVGDFSGENTAGSTKPRLHSVDIDNFDDLLDRIAPIITVASHGGTATRVQAFTLDDFHPDELIDKLAPFGELRDLRRRLQNPATFSQAAAEMTADLPDTAAPPAKQVTDHSSGESDDDTIERLLGRPASEDVPAAKPESGFDSLIHAIVAPHITPGKNPQQASLVRSVDASIAALMSQVLHVPALQALEARWRALYAVVSNAELDSRIEVAIWDTNRENLQAMLEHPPKDPMASAAAKLMAGNDAAGRWSVVASDLTVTPDHSDLQLIAGLASVTNQFGSPLLACASPSLYGCDAPLATTTDADDWRPATDPSLSNWQKLRESAIAPWIGLCSARLLQRMPYGAKTDPISPFAYEEFETGHHEDLLWGPASIASAALLATSYCAQQWRMKPGDHTDIVDLPAVTVTHDGQRGLMPVAEVNLTDRSAEEILSRGVMPVLSYKNRNAARVFRFQSVASPGKPLAGPWD